MGYQNINNLVFINDIVEIEIEMWSYCKKLFVNSIKEILLFKGYRV